VLFAAAYVTKTASSLSVSRAPVSKVMTLFKNLGKALSAKRNTGQKPKLSERDRHIFKSVVSRSHSTAATKVTAELSIRLEDRFHKNSPTGASLIHGRAAIVKTLITENKAASEKDGVIIKKPGSLMIINT
jgi:hypothetical protein